LSTERLVSLLRRVHASIDIGRPEVGLPLAVEAAAIAPNDPWVVSHLAWLQIRTKHYGDALRTSGQAVAAGPEYEWAHRLRATVLWDVGQLEAARSAAAQAVRFAPQSGIAWRVLARSEVSISRCAEALHAGQRAVEVDPESAESWLVLGWANSISGDSEAAESALLRARELAPENENTHNELGLLYLKEGRPGEAEECFRSVLAIDPRSKYPLLNLARCLRRLDRWDEAADLTRRHWLDRLHEADEQLAEVGDSTAYANRAEVEEMLRRLPAMADDLDRAGQLAETSWERSRVERDFVSLALDSGRIDEAAGRADELLGDYSDDAACLQISAKLAWLTGDAERANQAVRLVMQQDFGGRWRSICRARAALAAAEWRVARREFETYFPEQFGRTLCCENAEAAYARHRDGDAESADSFLRTAAADNPNCATLRLLDQLELMPVRELLPAEIQPWVLSEEPLA
jgi:tetratricopeptide (TPR) repeat protein